tara:strand:- start:172 stop:468 length:297 start_codon:yes stop_codon:yes gene_type:complete
MSDKNYTLKNPIKFYLWSVKSYQNKRTIYVTQTLSPKDFNFQVGQFVGTKISEMKLIGYKFIKDHWGNDIEETFLDTNKVMKQSIIDAHNTNYEPTYY